MKERTTEREMKEKKEKELSLQLLVHVQMGLIPRHHH
jgi:hypothetical protein